MWCGCPVMASPAGAIPEACGSAALYAGADAAEEWRQSIQALQGDPQLRSAKIAEGHARASRFTWAEAGDRLMAIIDEVARAA